MNHIHKTRWWFQIFVIFTPTCGDDLIWSMICFKAVGSTTNYMIFGLPLPETNNSHLEDLFFVSFFLGPGLFFRVQTRCWAVRGRVTQPPTLPMTRMILEVYSDHNASDEVDLTWQFEHGDACRANGFFFRENLQNLFCGKWNPPGDSKCPFHPLVGGHLTPWKGHWTIPKRSRIESPGWFSFSWAGADRANELFDGHFSLTKWRENEHYLVGDRAPAGVVHSLKLPWPLN